MVLCSALLGLTLVSCVGGAKPKSPEPSPLSPSPSPSKGPKTKILRTPVLIKETRYVGKDSLDSYTVYQYSPNYLVLLNKQVFDAQRSAAVAKTTYEYANGLLASETSAFGSEKNTGSRILYAYDASGRRIEEKRQDDSGNVLVTSRYEFDADGKKKSWKIYLAGDLLVAETLYEYVKGELIRIVMKNGKNEYLNAIDITRDKKGRELTRINKTIRNITESFEEYGYEGDRLAWEKKTGPSGKLLLSVYYEYKGTSGLLEKKTIKAPDGKIKEYYLYEYAYKEEEVPIE
jgi:YD repeat-containing protein